MRFLGSYFIQNALAARAPPRTPLGELNRSPDPLPISGGRFAEGERERRRKREEGKGYWGGKEGGKGREEGREKKGKDEGKGGEGEFASLALWGDRRPWEEEGLVGKGWRRERMGMGRVGEGKNREDGNGLCSSKHSFKKPHSWTLSSEQQA